MSFTQGLSGLNAASKDLEVIGNNVANVNTVGFKESQAQFADVFAAALSGSGAAQIGIGTRLATVAQQFTQGTISITNNTLDMAINGAGFFTTKDIHGVTYTRNGQFQLDVNGNIVSSTGSLLQGFPVNAAGIPQVGSTGPLTVPTGTGAPAASATITAGFNLDASAAVLAAPFDPTQASTFNSATSVTTYDSQGQSQTTSMYFKKTGANAWDVYTQVKDTTTGTSLWPTPAQIAALPIPVVAGSWNIAKIGTFGFLPDGTLPSPAQPLAAPIPLGFNPTALVVGPPSTGYPMTFTPQAVPAGMVAPLPVTQALAINFNSATPATQFAGPFGVTALGQDGYAQGNLTGFSIGTDGKITGRYSNGVTKTVGQVALVTFKNMQGLQPLGDNKWAETGTSGSPTPNAPGTGNAGVLQTSAVEGSNVDLTAELVNMVTAQRNYQANSQTIKIQDAVFQTLLSMR